MLWEQQGPQTQFGKTGSYHVIDNFPMMALVSEGSAWMSPAKQDQIIPITEECYTILLTGSAALDQAVNGYLQ